MKTTILNTNGERVTLTGNERNLGHGKQLEVIYSDYSKGFEHIEDLEGCSETILIKEEELREALKKALNNAYEFDWSGWRIPIYADEDGRISAGGWLSQGSFSPEATEVTSVSTWSVDYDNPTEEDIYNEVDQRVDFIIEHLRSQDIDFEIV